MQAADSRQQWMLSFGSSEIRSRAARSTCKRAIHSATPAGLYFIFNTHIISRDAILTYFISYHKYNLLWPDG